MQSRGNAPSAEQKRFRENLRDLYPGSEIHHCVGTTGKHNKVAIGHWWINALMPNQHNNLHSSGKVRKQCEKEIFFVQMESYLGEYHRMPVPDEVLEAIEDYHK